MNYRHAFHAGSFADVVKHIVLVRILLHLRAKPAAFRVIDTHAGAGLYDLAGEEAGRSGEWREGIGRLLTAVIAEAARALIAPYLDAVAACNGGGRLAVYPGSPVLVRALLRPQDRLIACELEPNAAAALARNLRRDPRSKAVAIDGWTALTAYVPPKERRGLILIRRSRTPPISHGSPMGSPQRIANGRAAFICCGIRLRSGRRPMRWRAACGKAAWGKFYASNSAWPCRTGAPGSPPAA
jgi:23S rRNA A2030 N6-methylase RlmJ